MSTLRARFLGTLDLHDDEQELSKPPTLKSQSLLAYLIRHRHRPQPRERMAGLFWGDRPEPKARHSLATALWHIRRCLPNEEFIQSHPHTVQFDPQVDLWLDVERFESEIAYDDVPRLEAAVALYRGDFLDGFYDDWIIDERYRLETLFSDALSRLMVRHEASEAYEAALSTALRLLGRDPLREDAHRLAMRVYCRLGQRNMALEQYRRCQEMVRDELGAEPTVETTDLYRAILEGRYTVGRARGALAPRALVVEPPVPAGRSPLDAIARSSLAGREQELAFLHECWQRTEARQGQLVFIRGEAGVGKTRLAEEFADRVRSHGARVLWGRCYEFEHLLPYQPVTEALRTMLPTMTPNELSDMPTWTIAEVARLVPELVAHDADLEAPISMRYDQEQARLFDGVASFLRQLSSHQALLLVVDDLHWASESTLQMLHYLARHLVSCPILLLGTLRVETIGRRHPLRALQRRLRREGLAQLLQLPRLSPEATEAMVVEMSGAGDASVPLAGRLYRETEGNPFFLTELVKALFEVELIYLEHGIWQGDLVRISEGELPLPASLSEAIQARVDGLNDDVREVLRLAAVLGREFDFDLLKTLQGRDEEATLEALDILLRRRLLDEGSGAIGRDYAFTHHKIQEVVYASMPRQYRQHAHARAGAAMENLYGTAELESVAGEMAHHFELGRELDKALTEKATYCLLQAGDRARLAYAHQEAIDYYQRALALLKEQGEQEQAARTLMKLGLTYHNAFDFRHARQAYEEGFTLWRRAGEMAPSAPPPPAPHPLRMHWPEPRTLDPAMAGDYASSAVIGLLFSGLVELTPELDVVPHAAQSWEVLEGGRKYVFHLHHGLRWSDGIPVTAGDFEHAWKRVLDPATESPIAALLYDVKGARAFHQGHLSDPDDVFVRALDKVTLAVELEEPTGYFLLLLTHAAAYPVPRHVMEAHGQAWTEARHIVSNGAFKLASWQSGELMTLARNDAYHASFRGNLERAEMHFVTRASSLTQMYEADGLDELDLTDLPVPQADQFRRRYAGEYTSGPKLATWYIVFDTRGPPFDDPRVRRAFALATDRETLADVVLKGYYFPATGGFVPLGMPGHSPGAGLPYDPEQAQQLLADAGYPGGRGFPVVDALTSSAEDALEITGYLHRQWREKLGVEVSWDRVEPGMIHADWLDRALLFRGWLADYPDPDNFLRVGLYRYAIGWRNKAYDEFVKRARRVTDQAERMRLYQQAERLLAHEAPIVPLLYGRMHLLVKPWVRRLQVSSNWTWFWKDVIIEPH